MSQSHDASPNTSGRELIIRRIIAAPPSRVWQAWTDPDEIVQWWGPDGFTNTTHAIDVRPGGAWRHTMHAPASDGTDYPNHVVYDEVDPPHRLVYTHQDEGACFQHVVTFEPHRDGTQLTMCMIFPSAAQRDDAADRGAVDGGIQTLGRLAAQVTQTVVGSLALTTVWPNDRDVILSRVFDAPRLLLWQAFTEPDHIVKWFGPRGFSTRVEQIDLRVGGKSCYVMIGPDGQEYPCEGVYLEIVEGRRIVATDEFGDEYDAKGVDLPQGIVTTTTFEDVIGQPNLSRLAIRIAHPSAEDRRKHEDMGVVGGWNSSLDCLDEHFASTSKA